MGTLLRLEQYKRATSISIYLSIEGKEIETAQIIEDALQAQKQVFVPYLHSVAIEGISRTSVMDMLALNSMEDLESFERDKWGIPSVPADTVGDRKNCFGGTGIKRSDPDHKVGGGGLDLIVVPGMAFDRGLGRLGHGKGYYDRLLSRCQEYVGLGVMDKMPFLGMYCSTSSYPPHANDNQSPWLWKSKCCLKARACPDPTMTGLSISWWLVMGVSYDPILL